MSKGYPKIEIPKLDPGLLKLVKEGFLTVREGQIVLRDRLNWPLGLPKKRLKRAGIGT